MMYNKIGYARRKNGVYIITPDNCTESGGCCFKDEEAYLKDWNAPCYSEEANFDDSKTTEKYWTHKQLLEEYGYNEKLCDAMFHALRWQCPDTWYHELDCEDFAYFYDWLKVGRKAFWWCSDWWEPDFYEVVRIEDEQDEYNTETVVWLRRESPDEPGSYEEIETTLYYLSETDISRRMFDKETAFYQSFIKPDTMVWWQDPTNEHSAWYCVDRIEDDDYPWNEETEVWLKFGMDGFAVPMGELYPEAVQDTPEATLTILHKEDFYKEIWNNNPQFTEHDYNEWLEDSAIPALQSIYKALDNVGEVSADKQYLLGDIINLLSITKIKL